MYQATKYSTHDLDILCPQNLPPWSDLQALCVPIAIALASLPRLSLWRYSFSLHHVRYAFCSRCSVNKISLFFPAFSVVDLTPEFILSMLLEACLAGMVVLAILPTGGFILHTPTQATDLRKWKEPRTESLSSHPALAV